MHCNAYFQYNGTKFDVNVKKLSYSWALQNKGSSQSNTGHTIYPYRYEQSSLAVTLMFADKDEYTSFRRFVSSYHNDIAGRSGTVPPLYFRGQDMNDETGYRRSDGFDYEVVISSAPFSYGNDMVAPEMSLTLGILSNGGNMQSTDVTSGMTGSDSDIAKVRNGESDSDYESVG